MEHGRIPAYADAQTFVIYPVQALTGEQLQSFREFPPRQAPAAFNLDGIMATIDTAGGSAHR